MKVITKEWVSKAEGDWTTLMREYRARKNPNYDAACFHAQQSAEKYLKARLQEAGISFAKTHNLLYLLNSVLTVEPNWTNLQNSCAFLTVFAVKYRYPGSASNKSEVQESVNHCRLIRKTVRQAFGLSIN
jgi:HEPN domain-containing protein